MISEAGAVVIGAGALGASTAFHLAKLGLTRTVLLDRFAPGSQTSSKAAGLFKLIQTDEARTWLARLSVHKVTHFEEETGVPLPVVRSGSLMLARTPEHAGWIREEARRSKAWGVELELIDAAHAHRLMPLLEATGIRVACHTPGDIYIEEPSSLLQAYLEAGRRQGVTVAAAAAVTAVRARGGEVVGVVTTRGEIRTPIVVNAGGAWARGLAELAGARTPMVPVRHQLYITGSVAGTQPEYPILRLVDTAVYVRTARGGLMVGGFENDPLLVDPDARGFSVSDVPLDLNPLTALARTVENQLPAIRAAAIQEHRGGLFTVTPDGAFILGPAPDLRGFWLATGCNGSGFSLSPAIGQTLAEWITTGRPSVDLSQFHPERFSGLALDEDRLRASAVWQYAHYYDPGPSEATRQPTRGGCPGTAK